jgi:hypothetical protein
MKHPITQEIFTYWNTLREARPAPLRSQINPIAIPKVLPDIFLLDSDSGGNHIFRLAGTRLCALFGRELRGCDFADLWHSYGEHNIHDLLNSVVDEQAAVVAGADGMSTQDHLCRLELILLPLKSTEVTKTRIIGCLSASTTPSWFSTQTLTSLQLNTVRLCWPSGRRDSALAMPPISPASVPARKIGKFTVYDGGAEADNRNVG